MGAGPHERDGSGEVGTDTGRRPVPAAFRGKRPARFGWRQAIGASHDRKDSYAGPAQARRESIDWDQLDVTTRVAEETGGPGCGATGGDAK